MIEVRLFAGAREAMGTEYVRVDADHVFTAADVKEGIARMYPDVAMLVRASRIAVGNSFVADGDRLELPLEMGKTIALIPPVSGG